jgi:hypothetical protein
MLESDFTRKICSDLKALGALVYPLIGQTRGVRGWPDRYVHHWRWCGFLEFKGPKTIVDPLQLETIRKLNQRREFTAFIVREPDILLDCNENKICNFAGTGQDLLDAIVEFSI